MVCIPLLDTWQHLHWPHLLQAWRKLCLCDKGSPCQMHASCCPSRQAGHLLNDQNMSHSVLPAARVIASASILAGKFLLDAKGLTMVAWPSSPTACDLLWGLGDLTSARSKEHQKPSAALCRQGEHASPLRSSCANLSSSDFCPTGGFPFILLPVRL